MVLETVGVSLNPRQERRFFTNFRVGKGCWLWRGSTTTGGYGYLSINQRNIRASRMAFEIAYGSFDKRLFVLHRCDNPRCVRPEHLFLGTQSDNMKDMVRKGRQRPNFKPKPCVIPAWQANGRQKPGHPNPGESNGRAVLNREKVQSIRAMYSHGEPQGRIAKVFGVSRTNVGRIVRNESWRDDG